MHTGRHLIEKKSLTVDRCVDNLRVHGSLKEGGRTSSHYPPSFKDQWTLKEESIGLEKKVEELLHILPSSRYLPTFSEESIGL
ncbi:hypothetical protein AVEN_52059-1 [Araneus ventricosus]|uniref:Uncharacterized protein n=1 Tax=Araneus ventricosus TaxID=182803 RepID=A0A4Y2CGF2_ARAVE|nr:hypothetical protein AVEN_52059-1 [Araneus ventricosus]